LIAYEELFTVSQRLASGEISPVELTRHVLERIEKYDPELNSFLSINPRAEDQATRLQQLTGNSKSGPLTGIPISVKDLMTTLDMPTTAGTRVQGSWTRDRNDSEIAVRIKRAGGILIGKTNLHEFAFGITSENEHFGPVCNPWDLARVPGGSSGGSGAAVAAGLGFASIGTDTRGSIRIPSACCGITGLKPTYGLVPMKGVIPLSPSLDHGGPMARSTRDCALLLTVLCDHPGGNENLLKAVKEPVQGLKIGLCPFYFENTDSEIQRSLREAIELFRSEGALIREISISKLEAALEASAMIAGAEALAFHDRYIQSVPQHYGPRVLDRFKAGYRISGLDLARALQVKAHIAAEFQEIFQQVDCLLGATIPVLPPPHGTEKVRAGDIEENVVRCLVRMTAPQNMAGIPALALPCGFSAEGLPISMQLIAAHHREDVLIRLGTHFQRLTDWHQRHPERFN